jgi:hypothetical protein
VFFNNTKLTADFTRKKKIIKWFFYCIVVKTMLTSTLADGGQVDIILLDFSKAFDTVAHQRLLHKLQYYGMRGRTLQWTKDFLNNRLQQVLIDGHTSSTAEVLSGVPQGTVLGPLLFLTSIASSQMIAYYTGPSSVGRTQRTCNKI